VCGQAGLTSSSPDLRPWGANCDLACTPAGNPRRFTLIADVFCKADHKFVAPRASTVSGRRFFSAPLLRQQKPHGGGLRPSAATACCGVMNV